MPALERPGHFQPSRGLYPGNGSRAHSNPAPALGPGRQSVTAGLPLPRRLPKGAGRALLPTPLPTALSHPDCWVFQALGGGTDRQARTDAGK